MNIRFLNIPRPVYITLMFGFSFNSVVAHHGFTNHFDPNQESSIEGTVTQYEFRNPHVLIYIDVTNQNGEIERWLIESAAVTTFYREGGLSHDSLKPGDFIKVRGHPSRHGEPEMRLNWILFPNGYEMQRGSPVLEVPFL
ncbi:MAG: hypothetical protein CMM56_05235 [Rhodospirillaceae bacterium]|nr:hypothetical protein [Rhodospirillaceae bacterium]|tara:strand:+ start:708 stop:1127 length:420 start_codon:yes stop_codon:yes gene_type:complete